MKVDGIGLSLIPQKPKLVFSPYRKVNTTRIHNNHQLVIAFRE